MKADPTGAILAGGVSVICIGVAAYTLVDGFRSGVMRPPLLSYGREASREDQPQMFWFYAVMNVLVVLLFLVALLVIGLQGLGVLQPLDAR